MNDSNETYEAVCRLATFLSQQSEDTGSHHRMRYLALGNYLKHTGLKTSQGKPYSDHHAKAIAVMIDHCWDYVVEKYGEEAADTIYRGFCDQNGVNQSRNS